MRYLDYLKRFTYTPNEFYDYMKAIEDASSGNIEAVILPAMTGAGGNEPALQPTVSQANDGLVVPVTIKIMNKDKSKVLEFFNGTRQVKVDKTSSSGTIAINDGIQGDDATFNLNFENGIASFDVALGGTWAENDTIKVTLDDDNVGIMGYAIEKNNHFLVEVKANPIE
jgi:hypothetical protein